MSIIGKLDPGTSWHYFDEHPETPEPEPEPEAPKSSLDVWDFSHRAKVTQMSDVQPEEMRWHWAHVVPVGKITLITGDPGLGKSFLTMDLAARTSRGEQCPNNQTRMPKGAVLLFVAEDDLADTVRPRLDSANADTSLIYAIEGVSRYDSKSHKRVEWSFSLDRDIDILQDELQRLKDEGVEVSLVIIDPISAFMGKVDSHNNSEVRGMLKPLAEVASKFRVAIVAVSHLNKSGTGKAVYRSSGALAFAAAARSVWVVTKDLDDPQRRLMLPVKCNLTKEPTGLAYSLVDGKVAWEADPVLITADEHLAREGDRRDPDESSELRRAVDWLREQLSSGKKPSKMVESDAKENDISIATLRRAKNQLECVVRKDSDLKWYWSLPN